MKRGQDRTADQRMQWLPSPATASATQCLPPPHAKSEPGRELDERERRGGEGGGEDGGGLGVVPMAGGGEERSCDGSEGGAIAADRLESLPEPPPPIHQREGKGEREWKRKNKEKE
uniref:Uncharacterized protein n=1 Tax=Oryza sativa subsp. japonica TaxID=39947 RepID=Q5VME7_ORYSJ|nr:hypothetical protein [Oryza sativa Japonica Group]